MEFSSWTVSIEESFEVDVWRESDEGVVKGEVGGEDGFAENKLRCCLADLSEVQVPPERRAHSWVELWLCHMSWRL
jgi:hypothetical protein